jgi:hypothetical protein
VDVIPTGCVLVDKEDYSKLPSKRYASGGDGSGVHDLFIVLHGGNVEDVVKGAVEENVALQYLTIITKK